ncbi:hypothetical protein FB45DRAFT_1030331 [Roridomyces roridus]|uniref:Uncharacterized protein n=1 Tax=Roridomyces roridus TaxID=1738132 RepID=A0AAD7BNT7_9AGAR|nr:hypothetical protein FB45DRAFT_1030331 [Roridomyces roridus]
MTKTQNSTKKPAMTMLARRVASAKYRENNVETLREKARLRMERYATIFPPPCKGPHTLRTISFSHREKVCQDPDLLEKERARAREASRKYRASHADTLAHKQRIRPPSRKKHGHRAWLERSEKLKAHRREAAEQEEWRRYEEEFRQRERAQGE